MTRPFAVIGFSAALSSIACYAIGGENAHWLGAVFCVCFIASLCLPKVRKAKTIPLALLTVCVFAMIFSVVYENKIAVLQDYVDEEAVIVGTLQASPRQYDESYRYDMHVSSINSIDANIDIKLYTKEKITQPLYSSIEIPVKFSSTVKTDKFGNYTYISAKALGTAAKAPGDEKAASKIMQYFTQLQETAAITLKENLATDEASMLMSMLMGNTSLLSEETAAAFAKSGTYHLFAVSGLHVSLWSMIIYSALHKLRLNRFVRSALASVAVVFYMLFTLLPVSAVRAGIMMLLFFAAKALRKEVDSVNSLGLAVAIILLPNPLAAASDNGLILSVLSTLGIITLGTYLNKRWTAHMPQTVIGKTAKAVLSSVAITCSSTLFTLPAIYFIFGYMSIVSPISNIILVPLASIASFFSGLGVVFARFSFVRSPALLIAAISAKVMLKTATFLAKLPFATVNIDSDYIGLWIGVTLILVGAAMLLKNRRAALRLTALLSTAILIFCMVANTVLYSDSLQVTVLNVGNGTAVFLKHKNSYALIGAGGDYSTMQKIDSYVWQNRIEQLDLLLLPRETDTEMKYAAQLSQKIPIKTIIVSDKLSNAKLRCEKLVQKSQVETTLWGNFELSYDYSKVLIANKAGTVLAIVSKPDAHLGGDMVDVLVSRQALPSGSGGKVNVISGTRQLESSTSNCLSTAVHGSVKIVLTSKNRVNVWILGG